MTKFWPVLLAVVIAGGTFAWTRQHYANSAAQARIDTLTVHTRTTDTLYRHDTLFFNRLLKVEVAKHDTVVKHLTDTVLVKAYIALQDSTIHACQSVVETCEHRVAVRDSLIEQYKKLKPSRISVGIIGGCGIGIAAKADCIVGVGGSVRIW